VGGKVNAKAVEKIKRGADKYAWIKIVITEGKNRQIRQMFEKIGYDVLKLQRVAIGKMRLGNLERGEYAFINEGALNKVFIADLEGDRPARKTETSQTEKPTPRKRGQRNAGKKAPSSHRSKLAKAPAHSKRKHRDGSKAAAKSKQQSAKRLFGD
jgi:23S rRNA pseudouridine2605 synthase